MARAFLTPPRLPSGSTLPATGEAGALFFKSDEEKIYVHDGTEWVVAQGAGGSNGGVVVSDTIPTDPEVGTYWFDSSTTKSYIYYDNFWIEVGYSGSGYIISETAPSNPSEGDVWFSTSEGVIYVYYDDFWIDPSTGGAARVPVGGTTGQVLTKVSDNDYDSNWSALTTSDITGVTATAAELNILDGATVTTTELNTLDGVTTTAAALNTIDDGTAGFTALSNGTAGISYQPVSHNYIINGAFDIWQRGESFDITGTAYTADRWRTYANGTNRQINISRQVFSTTELAEVGQGDALYFYRYQKTANGTSQTYDAFLSQYIENAGTLAGKPVTISFWAKADSAFPVYSRLVQRFGAGGSSSVFTVFSQTTQISTTWQRYSVTATLPSIAGKTIGTDSVLELTLLYEPNTTAFTVDLWGVQLELGSVATPFKRNAPGLQGELAACQRYYQRFSSNLVSGDVLPYGVATSSTNVTFLLPLPTQMRVPPTSVDFAASMRLFDQAASAYTITVLTVSTSPGPQTLRLNATVSSGLTQFRNYSIITQDQQQGYVGVSAEL